MNTQVTRGTRIWAVAVPVPTGPNGWLTGAFLVVGPSDAEDAKAVGIARLKRGWDEGRLGPAGNVSWDKATVCCEHGTLG